MTQQLLLSAARSSLLAPAAAAAAAAAAVTGATGAVMLSPSKQLRAICSPPRRALPHFGGARLPAAAPAGPGRHSLSGCCAAAAAGAAGCSSSSAGQPGSGGSGCSPPSPKRVHAPRALPQPHQPPHAQAHAGLAVVAAAAAAVALPELRELPGLAAGPPAAAPPSELPPPFAVLEFPPGVEAASCSARGGGAAAAASAAPAMSGQRVAPRFDVPLDAGWLRAAPDHRAELGAGRLELIMGPMFAGKTTRLISRVQEVVGTGGGGGGKLAAAVKSSRDGRYGSHWVVSHDGRCMRCFAAESLAEFRTRLGEAYHKLQVLAIDEGQFFPDLHEFVSSAVDGDAKHVIVAGLSGDFRRRSFGQLLDLAPLADSITQLKSQCAFCGNDAVFSLRLVGGGPQALVGGDDKYRAACRRCYLQHSAPDPPGPPHHHPPCGGQH